MSGDKGWKSWCSPREAAFSLSAVMLVGCGGAGVDETSNAADTYVTSTNASFHGSRELQVDAVDYMTALEMSDEIRARAIAEHPSAPGANAETGTAAQALVTDGSCSNHDLWIYDKAFNADGSNSGNRLCIKGPIAGGDLGGGLQICAHRLPVPPYTCLEYWAGNVDAYWPASDGGDFEGLPEAGCCAACCSLVDVLGFRPFQGQENSPPSLVSNMIAVRFNPVKKQ